MAPRAALRSATNTGLTVSDLTVSYGRRKALAGVSLHVRPGEVLSVLGHNGAGKTTLLKGIFGLVPSQGEIEFAGVRTSRPQTDVSVRRGMSFTPADGPVFRELTIRQNLELGAFTVDTQEERTRLLEYVHGLFPMLGERSNALAGTLSGGQQRMLAIGIALMSEPQLLLLDEPSLGIAPALVEQILTQLRRLCDEEGRSVLLVEQNVRAALVIADRACYLRSGEIILEESADASRSRGHWWDLF